MTLDVVTDLMSRDPTLINDSIANFLVVSIPVCLLWKVNISPTQKLGLASFLCLSLIMAIMAIVRVSGLRIKMISGDSTFDRIWLNLWQQIEASIAICLVSLTAFRQLFIAGGPKRSRGSAKAWYSSAIGKLEIQRRTGGVDGFAQLPPTLSATHSSMRTLCRGGQRIDTSGTSGDEETCWSLDECRAKSSGQVIVTNDVTTEVCRVRLIL